MAAVYGNDPDEGVIAFINKISNMCFTLRPTITRACKITNTCTHQLVFDMEHVDLEFPSHHLLVLIASEPEDNKEKNEKKIN